MRRRGYVHCLLPALCLYFTLHHWHGLNSASLCIDPILVGFVGTGAKVLPFANSWWMRNCVRRHWAVACLGDTSVLPARAPLPWCAKPVHQVHLVYTWGTVITTCSKVAGLNTTWRTRSLKSKFLFITERCSSKMGKRNSPLLSYPFMEHRLYQS